MRASRLSIYLAWKLLCGSALVSAQIAVSGIRGVVTDQSQAIVPGVEITATEITTNAQRVVISDDHGNFEIVDLKPGLYRLTATLTGFKTFVAENIRLEVGQNRRIEVLLDVGEVTDEILVQEGFSVIETESGSISAGVQAGDFKDVPGFDYWPSPGPWLSTKAGIQGSDGGGVQIVGQPYRQVTESYDGVRTWTGDVNEHEELRVTAVNNPADQSGTASISAISKSGDNDFHGMLWYKHVNSALNAREFFAQEKTVFLSHEWQAEGGGPIIQDQTFLFITWSGQRLPAGSFKLSHVPTLKMRQGDFSQFESIVDPLSGEPFPDNRIPAGRLNPTSLKVQELYIPEPNRGAPDTQTNNLGWQFDYPKDYYARDQILYRVDHKFSESNSFFFKHWIGSAPYILAHRLPAFTWTRKRDIKKLVVSDTHVF